MDSVRMVEAVIPGAQGRILAVLAETSAELNLRTVARLSGVSIAQVSRVLPTLVELGIVERREAPPSALFRFIPDNVAARAITALAGARATVLEELGRTAAELDPQPLSVIVFGSFARGEADARSDVDVALVRATAVDEDDERWRSAVEGWRAHAGRLAGNRIELLEVSEREISRLLGSRQPLWIDVRSEGVVVFGTSIDELSSRSRA